MQQRLLKAQRIQNLQKRVSSKSKFDTQGSYTGVDLYDKYEEPVQDADDL